MAESTDSRPTELDGQKSLGASREEGEQLSQEAAAATNSPVHKEINKRMRALFW